MKKLLLLAFGAMLATSLLACGSGESTAPASSSNAEASVPESTQSISSEASDPSTESTEEPAVEEEPAQSEEIPGAVSLEGNWKQVNSNSEDSWQEASITEDTITVYWVSDEGDTKSLYWAGTFETPEAGTAAYEWTSINDTEQTSTALLASDAESKVFSYDGSQISYELTAMGTTMTVKLEKE